MVETHTLSMKASSTLQPRTTPAGEDTGGIVGGFYVKHSHSASAVQIAEQLHIAPLRHLLHMRLRATADDKAAKVVRAIDAVAVHWKCQNW